MNVKAILCDAASVREGLLHLLGGGITQLWRQEYPARFHGALALLICPEMAEIGERHRLQLKIVGEDEEVGSVDSEFEVTPPGGSMAHRGQLPVIPLVLSFSEKPLILPAAGSYRFDVLVNNSVHDTVGFYANPPGQRPQSR